MADPVPNDFADPAYIAAREAAMRSVPAPADEPAWRPPSYAEALRISEKITSDYRELHRPKSMDVKPSEVCQVIRDAKIKDWVLMGLHGYVGYMSDPRATQDVDVLVPYSQKKKATKALLAKWPSLIVSEMEFVVRFKDPGDVTADGQAKVVIDLMLPWGALHETILKKYAVVDEESEFRIPTVEAALACKYAAMVSPHRLRKKKLLDTADFTNIVEAAGGTFEEQTLRTLGNLVWENGGEELVRFVQIAIDEEQFPL